MTSSKILFFICLSFIAGIFLGCVFKIPQFILWIFLFSVIFLIFFSIILYTLSTRSRILMYYLLISGFCALLLVLGVLRMQISEFNMQNNELIKLNGKGEITFVGTVYDEPDIREKSQNIKVEYKNGLVLMTLGKYPEYKYLDQVKITGKLETPPEIENALRPESYKNYLIKDRIYSVMSFPKVEKVGEGKANIFSKIYSGILFFKQKMRQGIQKVFLPPHSSILQGIILGDKNAISQDVKDKLKISGLSHVIAVSGTHLVVLGSILMSFLLFLGFWRKQAFYVSIIFICIYIFFVGLPSSGIRAGIMSIIFLSGQALGRQATSSRIIVLAGAVMLFLNPLLLVYDVGFQLSFLAVLGLIYFEPLVRRFLKFLLKRFFNVEAKEKQDGIVMMVSATVSAQVFTLPVIVFNFGIFSWVSLPANILILPVVYYLMLFGFLFSLAVSILPFLGLILSFPCYILLSYFVWVIDLFSQPWMSDTIKNVSWVWLAVFYFLTGFAIRFLNKKYHQSYF